MRSTVCKAIVDTLNDLSFAGQAYTFKRLDTLFWDPELTEDLTCYVIPGTGKRMIIDRRPSVQSVLKANTIDMCFVKSLESGTQNEVDLLVDGVEAIMDTVSITFFLDSNNSPSFTYFPREIDELELPEEYQLIHQENTDQQKYGGMLIKLYRVQLEEIRGDHSS